MNLSRTSVGVTPGAVLSYSSARTYLECPLRWKYLYIDKLPETPRGYFSFGRTIHAVLEELVRPLVVPGPRIITVGESQRTLDEWRPASVPVSRGERPISREALLELYRRLWVEEGYQSAEDEARYRALGEELLLRFYDAYVKDRPQPVAVEAHLETTWDGIPIHGYVDRIDRTSQGGLDIVDYKTSRELNSDDARDSDQLSLYQVLVERNFTEPVERLTLYHLRSLTPLHTPPRARAALDALYDRIGTVSDGIRSETYEPTPGRHCARCDFRAICPEFRVVPPPDQVRLKELVDRFSDLRKEEGRVERDLRAAAEELHLAAERLGVHRVPGSRSVAIRRKEEEWQFSASQLQSTLERYGLAGRQPSWTPEAVRRLVRDPTIDPEVRRKVAETGARRVKWYWEIDRDADSS